MLPGTPPVALSGPIGGLAVFAVSLLVGGAAIHVAARYVAFRGEPGAMTFDHAVVTALIGAVAWALLAWIPLLGPALALVIWIAVIRYRYPCGWPTATITGAAAWAVAVVALAALDLVGVGPVTALGVPGA